MIGLEGLRHCRDVAKGVKEHTGTDAFPLVGSVERGKLLIFAATEFLDALDDSSLLNEVSAARAAAEGDSNDKELSALSQALDTALALLGLPGMYDMFYDPDQRSATP